MPLKDALKFYPPPTVPQDVTLFGSEAVAYVIRELVKMKSYWNRVGPRSDVTAVPVRRGNFGHGNRDTSERTVWGQQQGVDAV